MARSTPGNYVPLDVNYARDAAIRRAGEYAELLYVRSLAYAKGAKSSGHIPDYDLDVVAVGLKRVPQRVAALVAHNLWLVVDGGWQIRSWEPWNAANEAESRAGKLAAHERHHVRGGKRSDDCEHCGPAPPDDAIASATADAIPDAIADATAVPPHMQGKGREVVVKSSSSHSRNGTREPDQNDLDEKILNLLAGIRPRQTLDRAWAAKVRQDITDRMGDDVRNPTAYVLASIRDEPDRYLPTYVPPPFEPQPNPTGPPPADVSATAAHARRIAHDARVGPAS